MDSNEPPAPLAAPTPEPGAPRPPRTPAPLPGAPAPETAPTPHAARAPTPDSPPPGAPAPGSEPWALYAGLSTPVAVVAADGRVVFINRRAEALWGITVAAAAGRSAREVLWLAPSDGQDPDEWRRTVFHPAVAEETPLPCLVPGRDGTPRPALLSGAWMEHMGGRFAVVIVVDDDTGPGADVPDWALRDPLTGLHNAHRWRREAALRDAQPGALVFFDLDGLKEINDLYGHPMGDQALAVAGRALAAEFPPEALVIRQGGDEFVAVLPAADISRAHALAARAAARAAAAGEAAGLPARLHLAFGVADFAPGGLEAAVRRADDALYEHKGVLLRSAGTGRIVLTRQARGRMRGPGHDAEPPQPGAFAAGFGPGFDAYFRAMFARAVEQAREFVAFADPAPGAAAVEVAAGSGRITFDGGLAGRIGPRGQLLVTDASAAQLQVARRRAHDLGLDWVRFLQAPVEDLPLASGTVDLVLGSNFIHFTDPQECLRGMARLVRPGGGAAVDQPVEMMWGDAWLEVLEPLHAELAAHGLPPGRGFLPSRAGLEAAFRGAGLRIEAVDPSAPERGEFPDPEIAIQFCRQIAFVRLMLRGVPAERHGPAQEAMEARMREVFPRASAEARSTRVRTVRIRGRRPE